MLTVVRGHQSFWRPPTRCPYRYASKRRKGGTPYRQLQCCSCCVYYTGTARKGSVAAPPHTHYTPCMGAGSTRMWRRAVCMYPSCLPLFRRQICNALVHAAWAWAILFYRTYPILKLYTTRFPYL